nr:relaxase/mobilization nuclease domain-containing protein [Candidatus Eremiobacteraeota bacterium]
MIPRKQEDIRRPRDFHAAIAYIAQGAKVVKLFHSSNLASIEAAPYQMAAVAACNFAARSVGYHFSLTLPSGVRIANDELLLIGKRAVRALGFSDSHQWVAAIHDDTDCRHIHFVINRIDPKTKYAHALHYDYQKLQKFRRNLAAEKGWERDARSAATKTHFPYDSRACDQESRTLQTSFQRYLGDYCAPHLLRVINSPQASWQSLHQALTEIGIAYIPRPRGAAIKDIAGSEIAAKRGPGKALAAKASHLGFDFCLPQLIAKFGPYEAPLAHDEILPDRTYGFNLERGFLIRPIAKHPKIAPLFKEHQDLLGLWEANRMVPAANHLETEKEIRHHTAAFAAVRIAAREALEGPSLVRRNVLKKIAHELLKIAEKHMRALVAQVKKKLRKRRKPPAFRNWLKALAKNGDPGALEALRILHLPSLEKSPVITAGENAATKQGSHPVQSVDAIIIAEPVVQVPHFIIEISSGSGDEQDLHMNAETTALLKARERAGQRYLLKLAEEVPDELQPEVALYAEYLGGSPSPADQWAQQILSECEREVEIRQNRRRRIEQAGPAARDRTIAEIDANVLSIQARQKLRNKSMHERKALLEAQSQERIPSFAEFLDVGMDGALD